jgi:hypothetical protein
VTQLAWSWRPAAPWPVPQSQQLTSRHSLQTRNKCKRKNLQQTCPHHVHVAGCQAPFRCGDWPARDDRKFAVLHLLDGAFATRRAGLHAALLQSTTACKRFQMHTGDVAECMQRACSAVGLAPHAVRHVYRGAAVRTRWFAAGRD